MWVSFTCSAWDQIFYILFAGRRSAVCLLESTSAKQKVFDITSVGLIMSDLSSVGGAPAYCPILLKYWKKDRFIARHSCWFSSTAAIFNHEVENSSCTNPTRVHCSWARVEWNAATIFAKVRVIGGLVLSLWIKSLLTSLQKWNTCIFLRGKVSVSF